MKELKPQSRTKLYWIIISAKVGIMYVTLFLCSHKPLTCVTFILTQFPGIVRTFTSTFPSLRQNPSKCFPATNQRAKRQEMEQRDVAAQHETGIKHTHIYRNTTKTPGSPVWFITSCPPRCFSELLTPEYSSCLYHAGIYCSLKIYNCFKSNILTSNSSPLVNCWVLAHFKPPMFLSVCLQHLQCCFSKIC